MNSITLAYTNKKGQVVIPKKMRDDLGIDFTVALALQLVGKSIVLSPIESVITKAETENSYLEVLRATKGAWANSPKEKNALQKRKLELDASKRRKREW
jgi:bifunctional DNA-binding transcriptional regulator/antitoxin component of YhaV-PrlF toxin-antitoxin module